MPSLKSCLWAPKAEGKIVEKNILSQYNGVSV